LLAQEAGKDKQSGLGWKEWEYFAQIHLNESACLKDAHICHPPTELAGKISEQTTNVLLSSLRVGRPFALGMTNDFWRPIGRLHKFLVTMIAKHQAQDIDFVKVTAEQTLALIIHSWENGTRPTPTRSLSARTMAMPFSTRMSGPSRVSSATRCWPGMAARRNRRPTTVAPAPAEVEPGTTGSPAAAATTTGRPDRSPQLGDASEQMP
jgi:hypothetical protein